MNKPPRRHHYVPQFLLSNFTDVDGKLWCYDSAQKKKWPGAPNTLGFERDLNSITKKDGTVDHSAVETHLANTVDGPGSAAIARLLRREQLDPDVWHAFIRFVAGQMMRTPSMLQQLEEWTAPITQESFMRMAKFDSEFRERVANSLREHGTPEEAIDAILRDAASGVTRATLNREYLLLLSLSQITHTTNTLLRMKWTIHEVHETDNDLVIGDQPVILRDVGPPEVAPGPIALCNPHIEVMMPLGRRMVAFGHWDGPDSFGTLQPDQVSLINYHSCRNAFRFIYFPEDSDDLFNGFLAVAGTGPRVHVERIQDGNRVGFLTTYK